MIFPLQAGQLLLAGGLVSCQCCPPVPTELDILLATATSAGGGLGCAMGPVVKTFETPPPYALAPGSYRLLVDFTTGDNLFHVGSYYQLEIDFTPAAISIDWEFTFAGVSANPWTVSDGGRTVRFSVEDSANCPGGTNANIQSGTAVATIVVAEATSMDFDFDGIAELQDTGYENISFYLRNL